MKNSIKILVVILISVTISASFTLHNYNSEINFYSKCTTVSELDIKREVQYVIDRHSIILEDSEVESTR